MTYCYDQSDCTDHLKDSLAASMRHSRQQAEKTYDRRTKCQRKRSALALAEELADSATDSATDQTTTDPTPSTSGASAAKKFSPGEFVAILGEGSLLSKPNVQIGQIQYYISSEQVELLWYKKRNSNAYSLELDSKEWIEADEDLMKVTMTPKRGRNSSTLWSLQCSERSLLKKLSDGE